MPLTMAEVWNVEHANVVLIEKLTRVDCLMRGECHAGKVCFLEHVSAYLETSELLLGVDPMKDREVLVVLVNKVSQNVVWIFDVHSTDHIRSHEKHLHSGLMESVVK